MDHLPCPLNPTKPPITFPYIQYRDGEQTLSHVTLPEWPQGVSAEPYNSYMMEILMDLSNPRESIVAIYQEVYFFRFLAFFLRIGQVEFHRDQYFEQDDLHTQRLSTRRLNHDLADWRRNMLNSVQSYVEDKYKTIFDALEVFNAHIGALQTVQKNLGPFSSSLLALGALYEVLFDHAFQNSKGLFDKWASIECDTILDLMREDGWCPARLLSIDSNRELEYYLYRLGLPPTSPSHANCEEAKCHAYQVDESTFVHDHIDPLTCSCSLIHIDTGRLLEIVTAGQVPILDVKILWRSDGSRPENIWVIVDTANDTKPYTAISHVWAQGLGNAQENAIHECRFNRVLGNVVDIFRVKKLLSERAGRVTSTYIWLDTLCVPLRPASARKAAVASMTRIYLEAAEVIAFDTDLVQLEVDNHLELICRVAVSAWATRLWTLQEMVLCKRLWVALKWRTAAMSHCQVFLNDSWTEWNGGPIMDHEPLKEDTFLSQTLWNWAGYLFSRTPEPFQASKDGADTLNNTHESLTTRKADFCEFDHLELTVEDTTGQSITGTEIMNAVNSGIIGGASYQFSVADSSLLGMVFQQAAKRNTSHAGDEALCIASCLALDLSQILARPNLDTSGRLQSLLSMMKHVPPEIAFETCARQSELGWRWAPPTLLNRPQRSWFHNQMKEKQYNAGQVVHINGRIGTSAPIGWGLHIQASGFLLPFKALKGPRTVILMGPEKSDIPRERRRYVHLHTSSKPDEAFYPEVSGDGTFRIANPAVISRQSRKKSEDVILVSVRFLVPSDERDDILRVPGQGPVFVADFVCTGSIITLSNNNVQKAECLRDATVDKDSFRSIPSEEFDEAFPYVPLFPGQDWIIR